MKILVAILNIFISISISADVVAAQSNRDIRSIDFRNFAFHGSKDLFPTAESETEDFRLRNGKSKQTPTQYSMILQKVNYGDVTGDGVEEAIINLYVASEGTAVINHVYIFTLEKGKPIFLWGFEGGDRAWGGLKNAYVENDNLVVELYGKGMQIGGKLGTTESVGLCCPNSFTRTRYKWERNHFVAQGEAEVLPVKSSR